MKTYTIQDVFGNSVFKYLNEFESWDDAEDFLSSWLGDEYEDLRCDFYIVPIN